MSLTGTQFLSAMQIVPRFKIHAIRMRWLAIGVILGASIGTISGVPIGRHAGKEDAIGVARKAVETELASRCTNWHTDMPKIATTQDRAILCRAPSWLQIPVEPFSNTTKTQK